MYGNGIQVHLNGGINEYEPNKSGLFSICSWYDKNVTLTTGYYDVGSMHYLV